jgi:hypothetical protein
MSFEVFKNKIGLLISKTVPETRVFYSYDKRSGKYWARLSDGTVITGHPSGRKITVRYGSGHQMMAAI